MKMTSARHAWHWAFSDDIRGMDFREIMDEWGVQFSSRGADNRIMDHVEKGLIQVAIHNLKLTDPVLWAWGMIAYAPPGTAHGFERSIMLGWLREQFHFVTENKYRHTPAEIKILSLARIAYQDIAHEDVTGERRRRKYSDLARAITIASPDEYQRDWHKHYVFFRDLCKTLPERALPPVSTVLWRILDLGECVDQEGAQVSAGDLRKSLGIKDKTVSAAERKVAS